MKKLLTLLVLLFGITQLQAKTYEVCFKDAAKKHNIPVQWLYAIAFTESSFNPRSKNNNRNGTRDYGFMQINSIWKKEAKRIGYRPVLPIRQKPNVYAHVIIKKSVKTAMLPNGT